MGKTRRGMIVKNTNDRPVDIEMATRRVTVRPGEELMISAEEVRDPILRQTLQVRAISIVRPATEEEEIELRQMLGESEP